MSTHPYPRLHAMVVEMAHDNGIPMRDEFDWPENSAAMEEQALRLETDEVLDFVCGEDTRQTELVNKHGIQDLDTFMYQIFDGDLHFNFYKEVSL